MPQHPLSKLPKVDRVLDHPSVRALDWQRRLLRHLVNAAIEAERERVLAGDDTRPVADLEAIAARVCARVEALAGHHPRPVLNGTGVILHTNLGRAPLSDAAKAAVLAAAGTCDLELDLHSGRRGSRFASLRPLLAALFGAQDAHVVTNGAAALLLACTALGAGGVALSLGQHVEIGDSFRVADMAAAAGVPLIRVGSTNRTHLRDYEAALDGTIPGAGPAAALLWVHPSNYVQDGFVDAVPLPELAALARRRGVPLIADLGSGSLGAGLPAREPTVAEVIEQGATIVGFSGDKLLGGPQAGLLAGAAEAVHRCRRHPMARALRPGKLTLAALHATALAHARGPEPGSPGAPELPVHAMIDAPLRGLRERGERLIAALGWPADCLRESQATIGGGSLPGERLPSVALVPPVAVPHRAAARLRRAEPPLLARIHDGQLWIDLRTLLDSEDEALLAALAVLDGA
ncbi:L-seryl-tRNA(Sec) selenium transferase [Pseudenhygromyxa sp. WMMC2535]|uniref:L-seryl-tRNA(Sec) selenium transferase n=1 Tax=Pseudenhygromyxa sp. WMMC2535 TaxID=2712867 RepID=UPI0015568423|nr:L-seryl-tRNA(Sec) selenium transferase [Pseudenhygromyxa sp. WMMC2535]NVB39530.1 L-seryl-tRNA(Sec) selenium transferase [Pseudenhygromyxa sp. WMMC2535]